jgi:hypothetical protein
MPHKVIEIAESRLGTPQTKQYFQSMSDDDKIKFLVEGYVKQVEHDIMQAKMARIMRSELSKSNPQKVSK